MAGEEDLSFEKTAIDKGFCTKAQLDDAVHLLEQVRKLGLDENIANILVKKKVMTQAQIKEVLKFQGQQSKIKIANYEILEKIGQGGMGSVFKARQLSLDRIVALKILNPNLSKDTSFCERFIKEARSVAKLGHPNIIVGIDVGQHGKYYYFAMEYVEGETALRILRDEGPFQEQRALDIALQTAKALEHAHKHNMVHRDIKPDNIMITPRGEAKLCDLGLAQVFDPSAEATPTGTAMGTPHYIAPEQAKGEANIGITADIYALGATLYHLVTGRTLFQGDHSREIMLNHLTAEAPNARKLNPALSEAFCCMLERMLAKNAHDRYPTPTELIEDLEALLKKHPNKMRLAPNFKSSMEATPRTSRKIATTGPRVPIESASTGPRAPIDRPDQATGPKSAVREYKPLRTAAAVVVLAVLVGCLWLATGSLPVEPKQAAPPDTQPQTDPLQTVSHKQKDLHQNPDPAKASPVEEEAELFSKVPPKPTGFLPLDAARATRFQNPKDFLNILNQYSAAESAASKQGRAGLSREIRDEKAAVERALAKEFQAYLMPRTREAELQMKSGQYGTAIGMFDDKVFPQTLLSNFNHKELAKLKTQYEANALEIFNRKTIPELDAKIKAATNNAQKLNELKDILTQAHENFPLKQAQEHIAGYRRRIDQQLATLEKNLERATEHAFASALDEAYKSSARANHVDQAIQKIKEAQANEAVKLRYGEQLDLYAADLKALQDIIRQGGVVLESKAGTPEKVSYKINHQIIEGQVVRKGTTPAWPSVVVQQGDASKELFFNKLESTDLLTLAKVDAHTAPARYLAGTVHYWRGNPKLARERLVQVLEDQHLGPKARLYLARLELAAQRILDQIHGLGKELGNSKLTPDQVDQKRQQLERLIKLIKREYPETEVFRARIKK